MTEQNHGKFLLRMNYRNFTFEANVTSNTWQKQKQRFQTGKGWACNENARNNRGNLPSMISLLVLLFQHSLEQKSDPSFGRYLEASMGMSPQTCQAPVFQALWCYCELHKHTSPSLMPSSMVVSASLPQGEADAHTKTGWRQAACMLWYVLWNTIIFLTFLALWVSPSVLPTISIDVEISNNKIYISPPPRFY